MASPGRCCLDCSLQYRRRVKEDNWLASAERTDHLHTYRARGVIAGLAVKGYCIIEEVDSGLRYATCRLGRKLQQLAVTRQTGELFAVFLSGREGNPIYPIHVAGAGLEECSGNGVPGPVGWLIMAVNSSYVLPGAGGLTFKLLQR